jgi:diketogulonate reductase-like aldo/keto reductase
LNLHTQRVTQSWAADTEAVKNTLEHPTIVQLAAKHGRTRAQVRLRWHIEHRTSAIPKSVRARRIAENIDILDFALPAADVAAIDALDTAERVGPDPDLIDREQYPFEVEN